MIENSYFSDVIDVVDSPTGSDAAGPIYSPKSLVLQNDFFAAPSGFSLIAIEMDYLLNGIAGNASVNLTSPDQVFVYSYDQNSLNNFQVYYTQQTASSIMPETGSTQGLVASPVSGVTNQQNWTTYGIATAGAVAPSNATTMTGIEGLVVALSGGPPNVIIEKSESAPSGAIASVGEVTTANTIPLASGLLAQSQNSVSSSSIEPSTSVPSVTASATTKSAAKAGKSKSAASGLVAGPLVLIAPRRNQVAQSPAGSRLSPQAPSNL